MRLCSGMQQSGGKELYFYATPALYYSEVFSGKALRYIQQKYEMDP